MHQPWSFGFDSKREEPGQKTGRHPVLKYRVPHGSHCAAARSTAQTRTATTRPPVRRTVAQPKRTTGRSEFWAVPVRKRLGNSTLKSSGQNDPPPVFWFRLCFSFSLCKVFVVEKRESARTTENRARDPTADRQRVARRAVSRGTSRRGLTTLQQLEQRSWSLCTLLVRRDEQGRCPWR